MTGLKKPADEYRLFMWCCVVGVVAFVCWGYNKCYTLLDELLLIVYSVGIMVLPYVARRFRFFG